MAFFWKIKTITHIWSNTCVWRKRSVRCIFFVVQRTCRARLSYEKLLPFIFWGYQIFLVLAASGYMLGITQGREYAEPEWYADILLTIVWVMYAYVYIATILRREEPHIYVANWFFLAYIILTAILHIGNNISIPLSAFSTKAHMFFLEFNQQ